MITINANAKINLTMDILDKRSDGYHEIKSIMQTIELADIIEIAKIDKGIKIDLDAAEVPGGETLPANEDNLAYRAAKAMIDEYNLNSGIFIRLQKKIPISAGLAGGSADAAAVIRGMNKLFDLHLSTDELCAVGEKVGSDVPFCIIGGTCLVYGRGEKLKRLPDIPPTPIVLVKPRGAIPTEWAYKTYDKDKSADHPDTDAICEALNIYDYEATFELLFNVFEHVAVKKYPAIVQYKEKMIEVGAVAAVMSGSGPTVLCVAKTQNDAINIAETFKDSGAQIFVTRTIGRLEN